ncbi:integrase core domain protein, partial [Teladorsagia circumcincta]
MGKDPVKIPSHPWEEPEKVWQRLHMDFCETSGGVKWLLVVDARSKWLEAVKMAATTAEKTILKLKEIFSRNGLPEQLVSYNGPPFTSAEFREYCMKRGIQQIFTPPYHPNSNGEAERLCKLLKTRCIKGCVPRSRWETRCGTYGKAPAEMLMGRVLRTTLNIIRTKSDALPANKYRERMKRNYDPGKKERRFEVGQEVFIRNYAGTGYRWIPGIVVKTLGASTYEVHFGMGRWKEAMELQHFAVWIRTNQTTKSNTCYQYFRCHRSTTGQVFRSTINPRRFSLKRRIRMREKVHRSCTSYMNVKNDVLTGVTSVEFCMEHLGHGHKSESRAVEEEEISSESLTATDSPGRMEDFVEEREEGIERLYVTASEDVRHVIEGVCHENFGSSQLIIMDGTVQVQLSLLTTRAILAPSAEKLKAISDECSKLQGRGSKGAYHCLRKIDDVLSKALTIIAGTKEPNDYRGLHPKGNIEEQEMTKQLGAISSESRSEMEPK